VLVPWPPLEPASVSLPPALTGPLVVNPVVTSPVVGGEESLPGPPEVPVGGDPVSLPGSPVPSPALSAPQAEPSMQDTPRIQGLIAITMIFMLRTSSAPRRQNTGSAGSWGRRCGRFAGPLDKRAVAVAHRGCHASHQAQAP
jgi:hypothetical protein